MSLLTRAKKILRKQEQQEGKKTAPEKQAEQTPVASELVKRIGLSTILTEKSLRVQDQKTVVFRVRPSATKGQIMTAIQQQYGVRPKSVRTARFLPKARRRGQIVGSTQPWKKAYVQVDDVTKFTNLEE